MRRDRRTSTCRGPVLKGCRCGGTVGNWVFRADNLLGAAQNSESHSKQVMTSWAHLAKLADELLVANHRLAYADCSSGCRGHKVHVDHQTPTTRTKNYVRVFLILKAPARPGQAPPPSGPASSPSLGFQRRLGPEAGALGVRPLRFFYDGQGEGSLRSRCGRGRPSASAFSLRGSLTPRDTVHCTSKDKTQLLQLYRF